MFRDNAAPRPVIDVADIPQGSATAGPDFSAMTDRELLEYNARTLFEIVQLVSGIQGQVAPAMEKLTKNPLLGGLFR